MFSSGASAQQRTFVVRLPTGQVINVTVDTSPSTPPSQIGLPGKPLAEIKPHSSGGGNNGGGGGSGSSNPSNGGSGQAASNGNGPSSSGGSPQGQSHGPSFPSPQPQPQDHARQNAQQNRAVRNNQFAPPPLRNKDGSPNIHNPTFVNALPSPNTSTTIPNFVIRQFQVPLFLLPIYQAAGNQYDIRWQVLAAINEIESDYGRNLNVSSAGAVGWMQFLPSTWKTWGVDANKDGRKDPFNPVDAIFGAARYLRAAGGDQDIQKAIFAYNHAGWYVDSVMLRARMIAGVTADLVGSLTGLTEGHFPVYAHARYADDLAAQDAIKRVKRGANAANIVGSDPN